MSAKGMLRIACALTVVAWSGSAEAGYRFTLLPELPSAEVKSLSSNGLVAGDAGNLDRFGWVWNGRAYRTAGARADITGVNARGHLVGTIDGTTPDPFTGTLLGRAAAWDPAARYLARLIERTESGATAINDAGVIAGYIGDRPTVWDGSRITYLPTLAPSRTAAAAESLSRDANPIVVGTRADSTLLEWRRLLDGRWRTRIFGAPAGIHNLIFPSVSPNGIYIAATGEQGNSDLFLVTYGPLRVPQVQRRPAGVTEVQTRSPQSNTSWGAVVGRMVGPGVTGFVFDGRAFLDLQAFAPQNIDIEHAVAVNNAGQIVGEAIVAGRRRVFLATPTFRVASVDASPTTVLGGRGFVVRRTVIGPFGRTVNRVVIVAQSPSVQLRVTQLVGTEPTITGVAAPVGWPEDVAIDTNELTVGNSAIVRLEPATADRFRVVPARLFRSGTATATLTLATPAPTGGRVVRLASGNPGATVPSSVTVPAGQRVATFPVSVASSAAGRMFNVTATVDLPDPARDIVMTAPMWVIR